MKWWLAPGLLSLCSTGIVHGFEQASIAQIRSAGREQIIEYRDGQVVTLRVAPRRPVTVGLLAGEEVVRAILSDEVAWQVTANRGSNRLVVKTTQVQGDGYLTVTSGQRTYTFGLTAVSPADASPFASTVLLRYASATPAPIQPGPVPQAIASLPQAQYRIRGDMALRPTSVSDDGARTYVDWPPDAPLPAVYARDEAGRESLTNGNMRDSRFVIDSVEKYLIFRLDKHVASAVRVAPRIGRR